MPRCPPPGATPSGGQLAGKGSSAASGSQQVRPKQPQKQHRVRQQLQQQGSQQLHSSQLARHHASDSESSSRSRSTAPSTGARPGRAAQQTAKKQAARRATTQKRTPQQRKAAEKRVKQVQGGSLRPPQLQQQSSRLPKKKGNAEEQQQLQQQLKQLEEQQQFLQHRRQQTAQQRPRIKRLNLSRQQSVSYSTGSDSRSRSSSRAGSPQPGRTVRASLRRRPGASQSPPLRSRSRSPYADRWMESDWYGYGGGSVGDLWQEPLESYYDWYSGGDGFGPDGGDRQRSRSWGGKGQGSGKGRGRGNKGQSRVSLRGRENVVSSGVSRTRVHVANLQKNFTQEGVTRLFQQHGKVLGVQLLTANSNKGEHCAIVRYGDGSAAQKAISALNGNEEHGAGTPLVVKYARPNPRWE